MWFSGLNRNSEVLMENKNTKAFILAAGFGTRLKPYTDNLPKALVTYKSKPMIENVISRLSIAGFKEILINTHHFSEMMEKYFQNRVGEEKITLIHEPEILGTGGAVKNAESFLKNSDYVIIYNTDVDSDVPIELVVKTHIDTKAMATLCVQDRKTSRYLLTDTDGKLIGRTEGSIDKIYTLTNDKYVHKAFCGIHIINTEIFEFIQPFQYPFDIIPFYMQLVKIGKLLNTYDITGIYWKDLGIPQNL